MSIQSPSEEEMLLRIARLAIEQVEAQEEYFLCRQKKDESDVRGSFVSFIACVADQNEFALAGAKNMVFLSDAVDLYRETVALRLASEAT